MTLEQLEIPALSNLGTIESKKMASGLHSGLNMRLGHALLGFVEVKNLGHVLDSSATFNFNDGQPKRQPDVSFVTLAKLPTLPDEEITVIPDLVAEVVSKTDLVYDVLAKVKQYQQAGIKLIWIIYPINQTVAIFHPGDLVPRQLSIKDELDGEDVLPGFKLKLDRLFK